jgi:DNA-binding FrmR family transcriptional regulator
MQMQTVGSTMLTVESRQDLIARLRKIEGQARGIQRMIEDERECRDILNQLASVRAATQQVSHELIRSYLKGCLNNPAGAADDQTLNDLVDLFMRA